jgi:hypothetical protein
MEEIKQFLNYWKSQGVTLPDPEQQPIVFGWYVKLYRYYRQRDTGEK